jgi:hypothetical protein
MPTELTIPKILTQSNWDKNKGSFAKMHGETGIGKLMGALATKQEAIDWALFDLRAKRNMPSAALAAIEKKAASESRKLSALKSSAQDLAGTASKVAADWKKSLTIPKSARELVEQIKAAADQYAKSVDSFKWDDDYKRLPSGGDAPVIDKSVNFEKNFGDISRRINAATGSETFRLGSTPVATYFGIPDMGGKTNPYIIAVISDAITGAVDDAVDEIVSMIKSADKKIETIGKDGQKAYADRVRKDVEERIVKLYDDLDRVPHDKWKEFVSTKKQYKAYKLESKKKVAKSALNVALTSGKAALSGGGSPMSLATAIGGAIIGLAKFGVVLYDLAKEAETVGKSVEKAAGSLLVEYTVGIKTHAAINLVIDTLGVPFLNTAKTLNKDFTLWRNKTDGLHVNAAKLAKDIDPLLDTIEKYKSECKKVLGKSFDADAITEKMEKSLNGVLIKVTSFGERYGKNSAKIKKCGVAVELISKADKKALGYFAIVPEVVNILIPMITAMNGDLNSATGILGMTKDLAALKDAHSEFMKKAKSL